MKVAQQADRIGRDLNPEGLNPPPNQIAAPAGMEGDDRISRLPVEIIITILSRFSVKDAIRTSALARSWRHLWTLLPSLRLGPRLDPLGETYVELPAVAASSWIERIQHVVSSLQGPFLVFQLVHRFHSYQSALLQSLLDLLLQKGVLDALLLVNYNEQVRLHLPSFHSLKRLQLYGCHVVLPAGFSGFECLTTLALENVKITNEDLHFLIHKSNNLTTLKLDVASLGDPLSVTLSLPLVRHLIFQINASVENVSVTSAPCLEQAQIILTKPPYNRLQKVAWVTLGLLTSVIRVSSLNLDWNVLESMSLVTLPFNFTFPRLRCLKLYLHIPSMNKQIYDAFICLLSSMPFLEELEVQLVSYSMPSNKVATLMRELLVMKPDGLSCLDQTLKRVTISMNMFNIVMAGITVVQFFLLNAKVLELMKIQHCMHSDAQQSMIEELQEAKVTSPDAKVVIFNRKDNVTVNVK
ncbi:F-box family protein [Rhynchospora pubera]|uniref:F-box family protein n=1 Tax=Rhynchospora pubera TaxID=906938 RepID=A0AAV8DH39_9POAL|nr:F-box family protein [Rhynchospora pubera]